MKLPPVRYERPRDLGKAVELLTLDGAAPLAGGQSLVPALRLQERRAEVLVDLAELAEMRGVQVVTRGLDIGAGEPMRNLERSSAVVQEAPLLARVLASVGAVGIRSRATLGGSLAWADPTSQLPATLLALGARVVTTRRTLAVDELLAGRHRTVLEPGELVLRVLIPGGPARSGFHQVRRTHITWPAVGAVAVGQGDRWRLAVYGAAPRPLLIEPDDGDIDEALASRMEPFDDERVSASYRREVAPVLARRALRELEVGA